MNKHFVQMAEREKSAKRDQTATHLSEAADTYAAPKHSFVHELKGWLRSTFGVRGHDGSLKEVLEEVLEEHKEEAGELQPQEKAMLRNVLSFGDVTVNEIMIPRMDILAVPGNVTFEELKAHILEQRHTRIPIYKDTLDHVEGFIHIKDLFQVMSGDSLFDLKKLLRPMLFVPPSMLIIDLLVKMRRLGSHMAIVVDEYGGTDGLVTLEDLFEEIVGDIQDEHDEEEHRRELVKISDHAYEVAARIRIEKLEKELGLNLINDKEEEGEFDTLGGLIFFMLGRVPIKGERVTHDTGIIFEILEADPRRIRKVRLLNVPSPKEAETE